MVLKFETVSLFSILGQEMGYEISTGQMRQDAAGKNAAGKKTNEIQTSYILVSAVLENVDNIKYLGATITNDLTCRSY